VHSSERSEIPGREWHIAVALVTGLSVLLQLVLTVTGDASGGASTPLPTRLVRFVGYFTIESNLLVCVSSARLALGRDLTTLAWRAVRLAGMSGIVVTGLVYVVALRPISDVHGWAAVADAGLHYVSPVLAVAAWVVAGPRRRIDRSVVLAASAWPVAWLGWVLIVGAWTDYYPYPFIDVADVGYARAVLHALFLTALLVSVALGIYLADRRLSAGRVRQS
jgi:hypothetical protein